MLRLQNIHTKGLASKIFILKELPGLKCGKPQLGLGFSSTLLDSSRLMKSLQGNNGLKIKILLPAIL